MALEWYKGCKCLIERRNDNIIVAFIVFKPEVEFRIPVSIFKRLLEYKLEKVVLDDTEIHILSNREGIAVKRGEWLLYFEKHPDGVSITFYNIKPHIVFGHPLKPNAPFFIDMEKWNKIEEHLGLK